MESVAYLYRWSGFISNNCELQVFHDLAINSFAGINLCNDVYSHATSTARYYAISMIDARYKRLAFLFVDTSANTNLKTTKY